MLMIYLGLKHKFIVVVHLE